MPRPWSVQSKETIWNPKKKRDQASRYDGYNSTKWKNLRKFYIKDHPLCELCLKKEPPVFEQGRVVDHILSMRDGGEFLDPDNLQTLCTRCHALKTNREINNRKKIKK